jgi:hypothetical protein
MTRDAIEHAALYADDAWAPISVPDPITGDDAFDAELRHDLDMYDTAGLKLAAIRKAYRTAERDWPTLPLPILLDATRAWVAAINGFGLDHEVKGRTPKRKVFDVTLSEFITDYLLGELDLHVVLTFRGTKFQAKGISRYGREALTAIWNQGKTLAGDVRVALVQLIEALPAVPQDEAMAMQFARFGVKEGR